MLINKVKYSKINMVKKMTKKIGIYIHIPFCKQKCLYCDFISFAGKEKMQDRYIQALKKEIYNWKNNNKDLKIETIYIGGGTPSYIDSKKIAELLSEIIDPETEEITIEINPGTITKQKLIDYKNAGINRLSIGLQSIKDELLKEMGRIHNFYDFTETYKIARELGFKNINVDLMIGFPKQTIKDIKETLKKIIEINPEHISVYSLIVEEGTPIEKLITSGKLNLPDEEQERNMYWYVKDLLELNGYKHYEISNFAKVGYESKHNIDCWEQKEYRGFGLAAHSYIDGKRYCNIANMDEYIKNIETDNFNKNVIIKETQNKEDMMKEYMMLGLRKIDGISIQKFKNKFNENPIMLFKNELNKLSEEQLINIDGDVIKISNKGLDLANLVWEEFV